MLKNLTERDAYILAQPPERSYASIGREVGLSRDRVKNIVHRWHKRLGLQYTKRPTRQAGDQC